MERLCIQGTTFQPSSDSAPSPPRRDHWDHLIAEYHHLQAPGECEWCLPQHKIRIALQEGIIERRLNGSSPRQYRVQAGDVLISPADAYEWLRRQHHADFLLLYLEPTLLAQLTGKSSSSHSIEVSGREDLIRDPLLLQIGLTLLRELDATTASFSPLYVDTLTHTIAAHLLTRYSTRSQQLLMSPSFSSASAMRRVLEYMHTQLHHPLTLAELAAIAALSPQHFAAVFKQTTGRSPHQYLLDLRIEQAKRLLLQGEQPISMIAGDLGFVDQSHFTRVFKRLVGLTPHAFALQQRKIVLYHPSFIQDGAQDDG